MFFPDRINEDQKISMADICWNIMHGIPAPDESCGLIYCEHMLNILPLLKCSTFHFTVWDISGFMIERSCIGSFAKQVLMKLKMENGARAGFRHCEIANGEKTPYLFVGTERTLFMTNKLYDDQPTLAGHP